MTNETFVAAPATCISAWPYQDDASSRLRRIGRGYLRTRNLRMVTPPDCVLLSRSRSILPRPGDETLLVGVHPVTYLIGPPADKQGAGGHRGVCWHDVLWLYEVEIQSIESPGPAMKPSSDIHLLTTTLPFPVPGSLILFPLNPCLMP